MGKTKRQAAIAKKDVSIYYAFTAGTTILRHEKITRDMKYIDKKYGLGVTDKICGKPPKK